MSNISATIAPSYLPKSPETGWSHDITAKPVLMRITTDLFVAKRVHSADEIIQFQEIALHLVSAIDSPELLPVAEKLVRHPDTPKAILQALLKRGGVLAAMVFENCTQIDRTILLDTAKWGELSLAQAIARRAIFDDQLTRVLCERPEEEVVLTLLNNPATTFDNSAVAYLLRRARKSPILAQALAARSDLIADMTPLFLWVPAEGRSGIILAARRMDLGEIARHKPSGAEMATHLKLERLALTRQTPAFEEALAAELGCTPEAADMLMQDEGGESLAIALASIGMPADSAARIFMTADPAIAFSVEKVRQLTELVAVLHPRTAARLASTMLGLPPAAQNRARHETVAAKELPSRPQEQFYGHSRQPAEVMPFQPRKISA